jgi:hypothetical protein
VKRCPETRIFKVAHYQIPVASLPLSISPHKAASVW